METTVYLYKGSAIIPSRAQTEAGFFLETEPVDAFDIAGTTAILQAIEHRLLTPVVTIPTPAKSELDKKPAPVVKVAGAKSWKQFFESAECIEIFKNQDKYGYFVMKKKDFYWREPEGAQRNLNLQNTLAEVWEKVVLVSLSK